MKKISYPPFVHWEVTPKCNHNCIHCYNYWRKDTENQIYETDNFKASHYVKIVKAIVKRHPHTVVITGGEPMLVFEKIKPVLAYLVKEKINVSINSNITLLSSGVLEFIKQHNIGMFISLPSGNKELCDFITGVRNSFERIINNLERLYKNDVHFNINIVASHINIESIEKSVFMLKQRFNIKKIYITRVGKPINAIFVFDQYLLTKKDICDLQDICVRINEKYGISIDTGCPYTMCSINSQKSFNLFAYKKFCTAGKTSYAIDSFRNIKACPRDSKIYGNILNDQFDDVWEKMNEWRNNELLPQECKKCPVKKACGAGCRVDAYPFTQNLSSLDTTAVLSNLPIKYNRQIEKILPFNREEVFHVKSFYVVREVFGDRISTKSGYVYVKKPLKEFLFKNKTFYFHEFLREFSVDLDSATNTLIRLLKNGLIFKGKRE